MFRATLEINGETLSFDSLFPTEYLARIESMYNFEGTPLGRVMLLRNRNRSLSWPMVAPYVQIEPVIGEWIEVDAETVPNDCDEQNTLLFIDKKGGTHLGCWDEDAERFVDDANEKTFIRSKVTMFFVIPEQVENSF